MTKSEISIHDYRSIVHEMAVDAVKHHLETGEELTDVIDLQFSTHTRVQDFIHHHPTAVIDYAKTVDHFGSLVDDESDPDEVLECMARRGFEFDIFEVATTITDITEWLDFEPGEIPQNYSDTEPQQAER